LPIEPGQTLLHYRLIEKIGEGGMGVVWKAVDTSLNREVAIKVLPDAFAADTERVARFEREAKLLASLNHPNVAAIYGIHEAESIRFLAMELVEGEDLAERLSRGALPVEEAIRIALEIARGFEAAHEKGVIHRDLKPANVKLSLDGAVKVLDFGLAKAFALDSSGESAGPSLSPTITSAGTVAGMILGTAAYMSPEQAKGKTIDRRADIWSFGAVLFEMLSGRRMFQGETVSETMAAVLMKDPEWNVLPAGTPGAVQRLLQRCLQREPASRLRDIGDARIVLDEALRSPAAAVDATAGEAPSTRRALLPWILAAVFFVVMVVALLPRPAERGSNGVMRLKLPIPESVRATGSPLPRLAISPDGRKVVFRGFDDAKDNSQLYFRAIDQAEVVAIPGTEGANSPTFSPDGQWIAFGLDGMLKKIPVTGGPSMTLCEAPRLRGMSWADDGTIVFAPGRASGLTRSCRPTVGRRCFPEAVLSCSPRPRTIPTTAKRESSP
jgi:serine/threonine protein kinase